MEPTRASCSVHKAIKHIKIKDKKTPSNNNDLKKNDSKKPMNLNHFSSILKIMIVSEA